MRSQGTYGDYGLTPGRDLYALRSAGHRDTWRRETAAPRAAASDPLAQVNTRDYCDFPRALPHNRGGTGKADMGLSHRALALLGLLGTTPGATDT